MIAILASYVLVAFLLIPGVLFKLVFSFWIPLRKFQRTRTEEITYAVLIALIPFVFSIWLVWNVDLFGNHPFYFTDSVGTKRADYVMLFSASYSEEIYKENLEGVWEAAGRISLRQRRFLTWYYVLVFLEAFALGVLTRNYGKLRRNSLLGPAYGWIAGKILLPNISEWHLLLTDFLFHPQDRRTVMVDVLTTDDLLCRGTVGDHFVDADGKLSAVFLKDASRFDRRTYLQEKDAGRKPKPNDYWKPIPGANLCVFGDKIVNLNLRYERGIADEQFIEEVLLSLDVSKVTVEVADDIQGPPAT